MNINGIKYKKREEEIICKENNMRPIRNVSKVLHDR